MSRAALGFRAPCSRRRWWVIIANVIVVHASAMSARSEHLRACLGCKFVQRAKEFAQRGCPNCEAILEVRCFLALFCVGIGSTFADRSFTPLANGLQMMQDQERVFQCTTSNYDGLIALIRPEQSWVAKWQRIGASSPGQEQGCKGDACTNPFFLMFLRSEKRVPGLYAVKTEGGLPQDLQERLRGG